MQSGTNMRNLGVHLCGLLKRRSSTLVLSTLVWMNSHIVAANSLGPIKGIVVSTLQQKLIGFWSMRFGLTCTLILVQLSLLPLSLIILLLWLLCLKLLLPLRNLLNFLTFGLIMRTSSLLFQKCGINIFWEFLCSEFVKNSDN